LILHWLLIYDVGISGFELLIDMNQQCNLDHVNLPSNTNTASLISWMIGWMVGWLADWLADWLVGCSISKLSHD